MFYVRWFISKEKYDLNKIDTKRTELDHLKKELKTFKRLNGANVPVALEEKRLKEKIQQLTEEIEALQQ